MGCTCTFVTSRPLATTRLADSWFARQVKLVVPVALALAAGLLAVPPANASDQPTEGAATITLPACAADTPVGETLVADCSYVALPKKGGGAYYAYLTSGGEIRMVGSLSGGGLTLPASGQSWPGLSFASGLARVQVKRADINGSIDPAGTVTLTVPISATIDAGVFGSCTITGSAPLSSAGSDAIGGGQGSGLNGNTFAVAGTAAAPTLTGKLCARADEFLDLTRGIGWYWRGTLSITASGARAQTASVKLPERIRQKGRTTLLKRPVVTNAGQTASVRVSWGTSRAKMGKKRSQARVTAKSGRVVIRTTGKSKKLFVRISLRAPGVQGFKAFSQSRLWRVS